MDFFNYYKKIADNRQKRQFRKQIIEACKIEPTTFYTWLNRKTVPRLAQSVIAELMQTEVAELFPDSENSNQFIHIKN